MARGQDINAARARVGKVLGYQFGTDITYDQLISRLLRHVEIVDGRRAKAQKELQDMRIRYAWFKTYGEDMPEQEDTDAV